MLFSKQVFSRVILLFSIILINFNVNAQFKIVDQKELEKLVSKNHQSGKHKDFGLYTLLTFNVKDKTILQSNFEDLKKELSKKTQLESIYLTDNKDKLEIVINRELYSTIDFIKIFKVVVTNSEIKFLKYEEQILIRKS